MVAFITGFAIFSYWEWPDSIGRAGTMRPRKRNRNGWWFWSVITFVALTLWKKSQAR